MLVQKRLCVGYSLPDSLHPGARSRAGFLGSHPGKTLPGHSEPARLGVAPPPPPARRAAPCSGLGSPSRVLGPPARDQGGGGTHKETDKGPGPKVGRGCVGDSRKAMCQTRQAFGAGFGGSMSAGPNPDHNQKVMLERT